MLEFVSIVYFSPTFALLNTVGVFFIQKYELKSCLMLLMNEISSSECVLRTVKVRFFNFI